MLLFGTNSQCGTIFKSKVPASNKAVTRFESDGGTGFDSGQLLIVTDVQLGVKTLVSTAKGFNDVNHVFTFGSAPGSMVVSCVTTGDPGGSGLANALSFFNTAKVVKTLGQCVLSTADGARVKGYMTDMAAASANAIGPGIYKVSFSLIHYGDE